MALLAAVVLADRTMFHEIVFSEEPVGVSESRPREPTTYFAPGMTSVGAVLSISKLAPDSSKSRKPPISLSLEGKILLM